MITRREAVRRLGAASAGAWVAAAKIGPNLSIAPNAFAANDEPSPALAAGAPMSPERIALIEAFKKQSDGLETKFESRTHKSDWEMPYRLFRPQAAGNVPLVLYLHGSGGLGDDNVKQLGLGNVFGTRVWLLPENQKRFGSDTIFRNSRPRRSPALGTGHAWHWRLSTACARSSPTARRSIGAAST
jgi:hypothetical protein